MSPNEKYDLLNRIKQETNCSDKIALEALNLSKTIEEAIEIAKLLSNPKEHYSNKPRKIIRQFENGLLIEGKFYDFKVRGNRELLKMLQNGEFDPAILNGKEGELIEVTVQAMNRNFDPEIDNVSLNKEKEIPKTYTKKIDCPDSLDLDVDGEVVFRVYTGDSRVTMKSKSGRKIKDVIDVFKKYTTVPFSIRKGEKIIGENEVVDSINRGVVHLCFE